MDNSPIKFHQWEPPTRLGGLAIAGIVAKSGDFDCLLKKATAYRKKPGEFSGERPLYTAPSIKRFGEKPKYPIVESHDQGILIGKPKGQRSEVDTGTVSIGSPPKEKKQKTVPKSRFEMPEAHYEPKTDMPTVSIGSPTVGYHKTQKAVGESSVNIGHGGPGVGSVATKEKPKASLGDILNPSVKPKPSFDQKRPKQPSTSGFKMPSIGSKDLSPGKTILSSPKMMAEGAQWDAAIKQAKTKAAAQQRETWESSNPKQQKMLQAAGMKPQKVTAETPERFTGKQAKMLAAGGVGTTGSKKTGFELGEGSPKGPDAGGGESKPAKPEKKAPISTLGPNILGNYGTGYAIGQQAAQMAGPATTVAIGTHRLAGAAHGLMAPPSPHESARMQREAYQQRAEQIRRLPAPSPESSQSALKALDILNGMIKAAQ